MPTKLSRIAEISRKREKSKFTSLAHLLSEDFLKETWKTLNPKGAPGVDRTSMATYAEQLDERVSSLVARLKARRYKATPARRVDIPKGRNSTRPLSIPIVEDRLLQKGVARILEAIFEPEFKDCSYGFRQGKNPHGALSDLRKQIVCDKTMWVYEVDIKGYFNHVNHQWLLRMLKERIADPVILRLISKWLRAGVMKDGVVIINKVGSPQGGPISCVLSNIYLHYVLDLWFENIVKPRMAGPSRLFRFVDDFVICFQNRKDALSVESVLPKRLNKFGLSIAECKTQLICFGRFARARLPDRNQKVQTFTFLGFKHVCGEDKQGRFALIRIPSSKACSKFLRKTKTWLWSHMHMKTIQHQKMLKQMLVGFYAYFGLTSCCGKMNLVRWSVLRQWRRVLMRRSQKGPYRYWSFIESQTWFSLPNPKVYHPNV